MKSVKQLKACKKRIFLKMNASAIPKFLFNKTQFLQKQKKYPKESRFDPLPNVL
ncbi:hypothetical protein RV03_GL002699 [Enterococcus gallinarum]|nr:hypothetical protein RV03_GL002699 [Enterococcus gallinarum]